MTLDFNDFQKQDIKFDINKLQKAYQEIIKIKNFEAPAEISNFGAISLTQIPDDPDSIKGHKARGVYWTKPDSSGNESIRDVSVDEAAYYRVYRRNIKILISKKFLISFLQNIN